MWSNLVKWYRNLVLQKKIMILNLPLIILPLCIFGIISNKISSQIIIEKTEKNTYNSSLLITAKINGSIKNAENCANTLLININKIYDRGADASTPLEIERQITNELNWALMIFPDVESAIFIDNNNSLLISDSLLGCNLNLIETSEIQDEINKIGTDNKWFPMQKRAYLVKDSSKPVLTLGKIITNIFTGKKLGILVLNISESTLSKAYQDTGPMNTGRYFIVDNSGLIVSSQLQNELLLPIKDVSLKNWILKGETQVEIRLALGEESLLTKTPIEYFGWQLISKTPSKEIYADYKKTLLYIVMIGVSCVIIAIIGSGLLSKVIVNPINSLKRQMINFDNESLDLNFKVSTTDEIGLLTKGFNTMIGKIRGLIDEVKLEQGKRREYELALIQAQIKPHFLYNALDTIFSLEKIGMSEKAQSVTKALADFYRIALSGGKEIISINQELRNTEAYLVIQKTRYSYVFDYRIEVDVEIRDCNILKLTIQPLVENSIYHGLKTKGSPGEIVIRGYAESGKVILKVMDNGVGIPKAKLEEIKSKKYSKRENDSFALINVDDRIKLHFGKSYGIYIESTENVGTCVTIILPGNGEEKSLC